jgi:hypothetical protein
MDHLRRKALNLSSISCLVLDEADEMHAWALSTMWSGFWGRRLQAADHPILRNHTFCHPAHCQKHLGTRLDHH